MNHSIYSADRTTHVKIVVVALAAAIAMTGVAVSSRIAATPTGAIAVVKAGGPMAMTNLATTITQ